MGVGLTVVILLITLMQAPGVFGQTWGLTLPQRIVGINGSCLTVPCRFEIPNTEEADIRNCSDGGVWIKGKMAGPHVFTARFLRNTLPGRMEDLLKKNCTTMFHNFPDDYSDTYFFRLQCSNYIKYTFSNGVIITVSPDGPPPQLTPVSLVSEGDQVSLQCSVPVPCSVLPPSITWFPRDNSRQERTQTQQRGEDHQMVLTSTLTFIASAQHHNQSVSCSVSYPLTTGGSSRPSAATQRLSVLYAPRVTVATLSSSVPVSEGRTVMLTCRSDANPPVSLYTWYRADSGQMTKKGEGEILVLQVSQKDSGVYLCEAQSQRGSQRSRPVLLEVGATTGRGESVLAVPFIICGLLLVLCITTVVVNVYKYQSISRRLKQIELKGENTYADLRTCNVTSDYDRLQPPQPKTTPSSEDNNYENFTNLRACFKNQATPTLT